MNCPTCGAQVACAKPISFTEEQALYGVTPALMPQSALGRLSFYQDRLRALSGMKGEEAEQTRQRVTEFIRAIRPLTKKAAA